MVAAVQALLSGIGDPLSLDPRVGNLVALPPATTALAFGPSPNKAFNTLHAGQRARARKPLRPLVLLHGIGNWTAIYIPASALLDILTILLHVHSVFEDLHLNFSYTIDLAHSLS